MKKLYVKPQVAIEDFILSENIASCTEKINLTTSQGCGNNANWAEEVNKSFGYFGDGTGLSCNSGLTEGFSWNGSCYHTSTGIKVFSS